MNFSKCYLDVETISSPYIFLIYLGVSPLRFKGFPPTHLSPTPPPRIVVELLYNFIIYTLKLYNLAADCTLFITLRTIYINSFYFTIDHPRTCFYLSIPYSKASRL